MKRKFSAWGLVGFMVFVLISGLVLGCTEPAPAPASAPTPAPTPAPAPAPTPTPAPAPAAPAGQIVWRLDHMWGETDQEHIYLAQAADEILEYTEGRLKIDIYPHFSLGLNPTTPYSNMRDGLCEVAVIFVQIAEGEEPSFAVTEATGIWDSKEQVAEAVEALIPFKQKTYQEVWGSHYVTTEYMTVQLSEVFSNTEDLPTIEDFKGFKVRTPSARQQEIFLSLGAAPQLMKLSDVYMGLKTGLVDGVSSSSRSAYTSKWYEVLKSATTLTTTEAGALDVVVSQKAWDALPDDIKEVVNTVFEGVHQRSKVMAVNPGISSHYRRVLSDMGMKYFELSAADLAKYREACWKVQDKYIATATPRTKEAWEIIKPIVLGK
ncbi:TRAP transporter substrate-binding protein [Chloroflexota bacterium]